MLEQFFFEAPCDAYWQTDNKHAYLSPLNPYKLSTKRANLNCMTPMIIDVNKAQDIAFQSFTVTVEDKSFSEERSPSVESIFHSEQWLSYASWIHSSYGGFILSHSK